MLTMRKISVRKIHGSILFLIKVQMQIQILPCKY
jgi:hypothetical protein